MTDRQETSRHRLLDAIECIKNCEAIVSHCNEIMDSYYDKYNETEDIWDPKPSPVVRKYESCSKMKAMATKIRRRMMKKIFDRFEDADHDYRCILKHAASVKQFADEVDDAEASGIFREDTASSYKLMSLALSLFVWEEPQLCARCMLDDLLSDEEEEQALDLKLTLRWVVNKTTDLPEEAEIWDVYTVMTDKENYIDVKWNKWKPEINLKPEEDF